MSDGSNKLFYAGVALAPCVVLLASRFVFNKPGPAHAAAQTAQAAPLEAAEIVQFAAENESIALAQAWESYTPPITFPSPFYQPKTIVDDRPAEAPPVYVSSEPVLPEVALTAVMGGRRPVAVVDRQMLTIGDEAAPGWFIVAIDTVQQTIRVEANDGLAMTVSVGGHLR